MRVAYYAVFVCAFVLFTNVACASSGAAAFVKVGQLAPEINLRQLKKGEPTEALALSSLRGKPVIVNFWATWCGPCRAEFPAFQAKYNQYKDSLGLVILAIDAQEDEGAAGAQKFADQMQVTFPILLDLNGSVGMAYQINGLPTTVFIDRKGIVKDIKLGGPLTDETLEKMIQEIAAR